MKIGSKLQYEVPDNCQECHLKQKFLQFYVCYRCPVFNCKTRIINGKDFYMVKPQDFRDDWAEEWQRAFLDKDYPQLYLRMK